MIVLAMDTSAAISVAVQVDGRLRARRHLYSPRAHAERLAPMVHDALADAGVRISEVDLIGVGRGPGPFTGLRVGLVTARTLGFALGVPVHGMVSLDAIAARAGQRGLLDRPLIVATDARRHEVYWARYSPTGQRLSDPVVTRPDLLDVSGAVVLGRGALLYPELGVGAAELDQQGEDLLDPHAEDLAQLAAVHLQAGRAPTDPEPLYLRRPDATVPGAPKPVRT